MFKFIKSSANLKIDIDERENAIIRIDMIKILINIGEYNINIVEI